MILITGTNDRKIAALRRDLLHVGLISEKTTLGALATRLSDRPQPFAVLHIVEKRRPALENVVLFAKHMQAKTVHGVLLADESTELGNADSFDFVLPLSVKPKKLAEMLVHSAISVAHVNPSEQMAGALRYRLFEKEFLILMKHFSFSDTYTALLCALMESYPQGLTNQELMRLAFLPLGRRARTNVSHAVDAINRRFFEEGLAKNGMPLICYDCAKGYFLRS